jgi:raffinose/stachyose/melibiose transport system substrate-binding protein
MTTMRSTRNTWKFVAVAAAVALGATACGSSSPSSGGSGSNGKVTLSWWSNANSGPLYNVFQSLMKSYHKANPDVSFSYVGIQNESWDTKIQVALQGHKEPDIFFQRGGGFMGSEEKSGQLANLAPYVSSWISEIGAQQGAWTVGGCLCGVPYDVHAVGFWYRKDAFAKAGITSTPKTLPQLESDVTKLKAHGIAPIAVGSKDLWPDAFYYDYFVVRECSPTALTAAVKADSADYGCFAKAGNDLQKFMATSPFQNAFLNTPSQVGAGSSAGMVADGQAAMELQGDWDPSVMQALVPASTWTADTTDLGWFPFPSVPGASGSAGGLLGGSDGNSCAKSAPEPACADFLEYLDSPSAQKKIVSAALLPVNPAASSAVTLGADLELLNNEKTTSDVQEYLDLAYPTAVGTALDSAVADFFANPAGSPQAIVSAIDQAAAQQG